MASQELPRENELPEVQAELIVSAIAGDRVALERLLLAHYDMLFGRVAQRLPERLRATQAVEDILQLTFWQAFRDIGRFEQRDDATFGNWLARIADNRLLDAIKQFDAPKRGGDLNQIAAAARDDSRVLSLWDWIVADDASPSSIVARNEAMRALHVALAALSHDQREAVRLRMLEGKSLDETAAAMGRSPDAIRGLVHRGKEQLQAAMGRASLWLKSK